MTRFTVTNHEVAAHAAQQLHGAAQALSTRIDAAADPLADLTPESTPEAVLTALAQSHRMQQVTERTEAELVLLLHECGASARGIADAVGMHRERVARLIKLAEAERDVEAGR